MSDVPFSLLNDASYNNGNRWFVQQWPHAVLEFGTQINIVFDPLHAYWFNFVGGVYVAQYGAKEILVHDTTNNVFRMTEPDGTFWEFYDFSVPTLPKGLFKRQVTPGGQAVAASMVNATQILQMQLSLSGSGAVYEQYDYGYGTAGGAAGQLTAVTLSRFDSTSGTLAPLRQASYSYYGSGDPCGLSGDLQSALCQSASGGGWAGSDTYYYRYYTTSGSGGLAHGMKYAFRPQAYHNVTAALGHAPTSADADSAVAPFACFYFAYNDPTHPNAVTNEMVFAQSQSYSFTYTDGTTSADPNAWQRKTVERQYNATGGSMYSSTVYTNFIGQVLLNDLTDTGGNHWRSYSNYDPSNRLLLTAEPSAVARESKGGQARLLTFGAEKGIESAGQNRHGVADARRKKGDITDIEAKE